MTDNLTSATPTGKQKIKNPFAKIICNHDGNGLSRYFSILWWDTKKLEMQEGYSSYSLRFVCKWFQEEFEVQKDIKFEAIICSCDSTNIGEVDLIDRNALRATLIDIDDRANVVDLARALIKCVKEAPSVKHPALSEVPLEVKTTTDDFLNIEVAKEKGYYRYHFFCPSCQTEIGDQIFDSRRMFGQGTILKSNKFPKYCPECGQKLGGIKHAEK